MISRKLYWPILIVFCLILGGLYLNTTPWFRLKLAKFYESRNNQYKAIKAYDKIYVKEKVLQNKYKLLNFYKLAPEQKYEISKKLADYYFKTGNKNRAIEHYKVLKELKPDKIKDYLNLYVLNQNVEDLVENILNYKELNLQEFLPLEYLKSPFWRYNLAIGLAKKERWRESEEILTQLVSESPYLFTFQRVFSSIQEKVIPSLPFDIAGIWNFDEGKGEIVKDTSGRYNNGQIEGAKWVDGVNDKALRFDGVNATVVIPDNPSLHLDGRDFTITMWVKPLPQKKYRFVYWKVFPNLCLDKDDTTWSFQLQTIEKDSRIYRNINLFCPIQNKWYFIVQRVKQNLQHKAWLFDQQDLIKTAEVQGNAKSVSSDGYGVELGRLGWSSISDNAYFKGIIDEVRIFNCALDDKEIECLYKTYQRKIMQ